MWSLENEVRDEFRRLYASNLVPTAVQLAELTAMHVTPEGSAARLLTIVGENAEITIDGVITEKPSFFSMIFGGGNPLWSEIVEAIHAADADATVTNLTIKANSGGGTVSGMIEAMEVMRDFSKPSKTIVGSLAASAMFAFASQTDSIVAAGKGSRFGSVGIVSTRFKGENEIEISSTHAPNKRPDPTTDDGKAVIVAELDEVHAMMATEIASGRGTTIDKVNAEFGRGGTMLAESALKAGMIDQIGAAEKSTPKSSGQESTHMDLTKLKAEHPALYDEVIALGRAEGQSSANAHLILAEASGDYKTAVAAIKAGTGVTDEITATHVAAGIAKVAMADRVEDDANASTHAKESDSKKAAEKELAGDIAASLDKMGGGAHAFAEDLDD